MAVSGADAHQLREAARRFQEAADRLQSSVKSLSAITGNPAVWRGPDADRFRSEWSAQSVRGLNNATQALREGADALRRNADEQEAASRADGAGAAGSTGAWASAPTADYGAAAQKSNDMWTQVRKVPDNAYRVQMVQGEDGKTRYVVYIGGTTGEWGGEGQSKLANVPAARGQLDDAQVKRLYELIPKDAEVMLVGYSQGGMDAQNIAKDGKLNVTQIVTFGSPSRDDLDVPAVHLRAQDDPIPGTTSVASRAGAAAFVAGVASLPSTGLLGSAAVAELGHVLVDSVPYSGSDLESGANNEFYKRDSDLATNDGWKNHEHGYDSVSKYFDDDVRSGQAGSQFLHTNDFQGDVIKQVDIAPNGVTC